MSKKKINLKKETLVNLQEDQMKALIGAKDMSGDSGVACDNTVTIDVPILARVEASCCRRSC